MQTVCYGDGLHEISKPVFLGKNKKKMFQSVAAESVTKNAKRSHDIRATILHTIM